MAIVEAVQKSTLVRNLKDADALTRVVAKWRAYLGIPKEGADPEELAIVVMYIKQNWEMLTLSEIELAFTLSINRKLDDSEFYGYFSPNYVAKVLHSYMYYRKVTLADALRMKEKHELEEASKMSIPSPAQQAETTKELIRNFHDEIGRKGRITDPFNLAYNFLRKHKWLKVSESDIKESLDAGRVMYDEQRLDSGMMSRLSNDDHEVEVKRHARNYLVTKYLKNVDINVLLDNIKPELFDTLD